MATNANLTTANDLRNRVCELLAYDVTMGACRSAMHGLGWTRYESLTDEQVGQIADAVRAPEILRALGLEVRLVRDEDSNGWVAAEAMGNADARRAVVALRAAGYEASDAGDAEDGSVAWLYVRAMEAAQ